jgi:hypothetical protein
MVKVKRSSSASHASGCPAFDAYVAAEVEDLDLK